MTLARIEQFIGQTSRPLSILIATCGATAAGVITSLKVEDGTDGALLLAAIWAGAGGLFLAKGIEIWKGSKDAASVEIAKAATLPSEPLAVEVVNAPDRPVPVDPEVKP